MMFTRRLAMAAVSLTTVACSAAHPVDQDQLTTGSNLTAVSVALPTTDQLPASLLDQKLYYCFAIEEALPAQIKDGDAKLPCSMPALSTTFSSEGDYQQNIKLEKSLDAKTSYLVSLAVGVKADQTIDAESIHYLGSSSVTQADMTGKDKLSLSLTMKKIGDGDGTDVITTNTSLDLEVVPVFDDEEDSEPTDDGDSTGEDDEGKIDADGQTDDGKLDGIQPPAPVL